MCTNVQDEKKKNGEGTAVEKAVCKVITLKSHVNLKYRKMSTIKCSQTLRLTDKLESQQVA